MPICSWLVIMWILICSSPSCAMITVSCLPWYHYVVIKNAGLPFPLLLHKKKYVRMYDCITRGPGFKSRPCVKTARHFSSFNPWLFIFGLQYKLEKIKEPKQTERWFWLLKKRDKGKRIGFCSNTLAQAWSTCDN